MGYALKLFTYKKSGSGPTSNTTLIHLLFYPIYLHFSRESVNIVSHNINEGEVYADGFVLFRGIPSHDLGSNEGSEEIMIWEIIKVVLIILVSISVLVTLYFFNLVSENEAEEMGVVTPKMARDPDVIERLERETPLGVKRELQEAISKSKDSEMADKEIGEDGVVRRRKL